MEHLIKEFNNFMLLGRNIPEAEFANKSDEFLKTKSKKEQEFISDYFVKFFSNKLNQYKEINSEISKLEQLEKEIA